MANGNPLQILKEELKQLRTDKEFDGWQPLFDQLEPLTNVVVSEDAQSQIHDQVKGTIAVIRKLQALREGGTDIRTHINTIQGGYVQPDWLVAGDVQQANRDIINRTIIQVFQQSGDQLKLDQPAPTIPIPIVVVAMTGSEAEELVSHEAFNNQPLLLSDHFDILQSHLTQACPTWPKRYGESALDWRPFGDEVTVQVMVEESFEISNRDLTNVSKRPLAPYFKTVQDLKENRGELRRMRMQGCIVILDIISMRHPEVQSCFQRTLLDAYHNTSVVSIAPTAQALDMARDLAVIVQLKLADMEFWRRQNDIGEYGASEVLNNRGRFTPWLSTRVIDLIPPEDRRGAPRYSEALR
jgi:hypothetical protein